ncbi:MAG: glycosyltransferase family 4 protein [Vicinamibacteria bacterium]
MTFANGRALSDKHRAQGATVHETKTTTLGEGDIATRMDACAGSRVRLLTVSRIDPRKGLRVLPDIVARLVAQGIDATWDLVGPPIGQLGEDERRAILEEAARHGVADRVIDHGRHALDALLPLYREYDVFVLPTGPGEGIPRVLLEAMAGGLPVVTTRVAGIGSLVEDGGNGVLVPDPSPPSIADAVRRIVRDQALRTRVLSGGYETVRAHTLDRQAAEMMAVVRSEVGRN